MILRERLRGLSGEDGSRGRARGCNETNVLEISGCIQLAMTKLSLRQAGLVAQASCTIS